MLIRLNKNNTTDKSNKKMSLNISRNYKTSWYHKYQYDYKNLDENIIYKLFE